MMNSERRDYHEDTALFREALSFTQSETGFSARLVENDYYGSLLLEDLISMGDSGCAFKGGTCLSKVHSEFCRLSEDLDFGFSVPVDASRSLRSSTIKAMKAHLARLPQRLRGIRVAEPLRGYNNSTQYIGQLCYRSQVTGQDETIKVEFSIREPILEPVECLPAGTLLVDPFRHRSAIGPLAVPVLSRRETYAEKARAALTRREPAIRDFYDIDHGIRAGKLSLNDSRLIELLAAKLAVPGNDPVDVSDRKRNSLLKQVHSQLRPVLRESDYGSFDMERAFSVVTQLAAALPRSNS